MKKVFKYPIPIEDFFSLKLPLGTEILHIAEQRDKAFLWALVNLDTDCVETRKFRLAGTGHPIESEKIVYIGTFSMMGNNLIWHVFELY